MGSLFWHLANRTAETEFIFSLFHLLLAGLTLLVLLHRLRVRRATPVQASDRILTAGTLILSPQWLSARISGRLAWCCGSC